MGAGSSRKISKEQLAKLKSSTGLNDRAIQILYARFVYMYTSTIKEQKQLEKIS